MTKAVPQDLFAGWNRNNDEYSALVHAYRDKDSPNGLLEQTITADTKRYISDQTYLKNFPLAAFNTFVPGIRAGLHQVNGDTVSNTQLVDELTEYFEHLYWDLIIIGYLSAVVSYNQPGSPASRIPKGAVPRRKVENLAKEVDEEFRKGIMDARVWQPLTQPMLQILIILMTKLDKPAMKKFPVLRYVLQPNLPGEQNWSIGGDAARLFGLGITLAVNDVVGK